jgi:hypothetical protein
MEISLTVGLASALWVLMTDAIFVLNDLQSNEFNTKLNIRIKTGIRGIMDNNDQIKKNRKAEKNPAKRPAII